MSAINLHRWLISKITGINTETQEILQVAWSAFKNCILTILGGGYAAKLNEQNRTAGKQEDWKNDYLHSAFNTCIKEFVS